MDFIILQFSDISSRAVEEGICLYTGQWERIDSNMRWLPKTYALFVLSLSLSPAGSIMHLSIFRAELMASLMAM